MCLLCERVSIWRGGGGGVDRKADRQRQERPHTGRQEVDRRFAVVVGGGGGGGSGGSGGSGVFQLCCFLWVFFSILFGLFLVCLLVYLFVCLYVCMFVCFCAEQARPILVYHGDRSVQTIVNADISSHSILTPG